MSFSLSFPLCTNVNTGRSKRQQRWMLKGCRRKVRWFPGTEGTNNSRCHPTGGGDTDPWFPNPWAKKEKAAQVGLFFPQEKKSCWQHQASRIPLARKVHWEPCQKQAALPCWVWDSPAFPETHTWGHLRKSLLVHQAALAGARGSLINTKIPKQIKIKLPRHWKIKLPLKTQPTKAKTYKLNLNRWLPIKMKDLNRT